MGVGVAGEVTFRGEGERVGWPVGEILAIPTYPIMTGGPAIAGSGFGFAVTELILVEYAGG